MTIDIDKLTEAELVDLNHRIVERLRLLRQMRSHVAMMEFRIGDRVVFEPPGRPPERGTITRYNKNTVSVVTDSGHRWTVAPSLLRRDSGAAAHSAGAGPILDLKADC